MKKSKQANRLIVGGFWQLTKPYLSQFGIAAGGAVLAVLTQSILAPFIVSRAFARLQQNYSHSLNLNFSVFMPYIWSYAAVMIAGFIIWRVQSYYTWKLEISVRKDAIIQLFKHLGSMSQRFHADRYSGAIVSQANKYTGAYERMMDDLIWNILPGLATLVFSVIVLSIISLPYALGMLGLSLLYMVLMFIRIVKQLPINARSSAMESTETAALADAITNMDTIRAFGQERYENERFSETAKRTYQANSVLAKEVFKSEALSHGQTSIFQILAVAAGLLAVTKFHANIGLLYLLISYSQGIVNQIWQFSRIIRNINRSLGDATEMTAILAIEPEVQDPTQPTPATFRRGRIEFKNVHFNYPEAPDAPLFDHLNLVIKPGERVGLVGPSGGGKTTITKLLLRFMDIQAGQILIDDQDIKDMRQHELRQNIAYVPQDPILFHRSLLDNIAYGNLSASMEEIVAATKMAHAHDFIKSLNKGYDTLVGERGIKLSGGQRQRVAIARAMLKNAPIIILDEATSALDSSSEILIQEALWQLMDNRTAIVIAHRLSTIQKMDRILVLNKGKIVEQGTHKELLSLNGVYAQLWSHQSGGFIES